MVRPTFVGTVGTKLHLLELRVADRFSLLSQHCFRTIESNDGSC